MDIRAKLQGLYREGEVSGAGLIALKNELTININDKNEENQGVIDITPKE